MASLNWGDSQDTHPPIFHRLPSAPNFVGPLTPTCEPFLGGLGVIVKNSLTSDECKALIKAVEEQGFQSAEEYCFRYRDRLNDRFMSDDSQLADVLWSRVQQFVPETITDPFGPERPGVWEVDKLNIRFRFCKYIGGKGHHFGAHTDGMFRIDDAHTSLLTCMFYLNGTDEFQGGTTDFIEYKTHQLKHSVCPEPGLCVIFRQANLDCYHLGTEVTSGVKYILRTDIMYHSYEDLN